MSAKKQILLIDDHENWQNSLSELLEEANYNVSLAQDPEEAIKKLEKKPAMLVIVDIMSQETDIGVGLIGLIRKKYPDMPIIAMSAQRKIMTLSRVHELYGTHRISAYVDKVSFDSEQFLALINKVLLESEQKTPQNIFIAHDYQGEHKTTGDKLSKLLRSVGYTVYRPADDPQGGSLWLGIQNEIDRSDLGFFDITSLNPNVCFELGYALGKRKPYYLLLNEKLRHLEVPYNLSGELRVQYASEIELLDEIVKILRPTEFLDEKFAYDHVDSQKIRIQPNSALVILPNESYQRRIIGPNLIKVLKKRHYKPRSLRIEDANDLDKVYQMILKMEIIIGGVIGEPNDLSKSRNAEVMVALGIALGAGKTTILLQQNKDGPSDLKSLVRTYIGITEAMNQLDSALSILEVDLSNRAKVTSKPAKEVALKQSRTLRSR